MPANFSSFLKQVFVFVSVPLGPFRLRFRAQRAFRFSFRFLNLHLPHLHPLNHLTHLSILLSFFSPLNNLTIPTASREPIKQPTVLHITSSISQVPVFVISCRHSIRLEVMKPTSKVLENAFLLKYNLKRKPYGIKNITLYIFSCSVSIYPF